MPLGVTRVNLLRFALAGNATTEIGSTELLEENDMEAFLASVDKVKQLYRRETLRLSFSLGFGPNFSGLSLEDARTKVIKGVGSWTKSPYLCPAIDGQYWGVSTKSGRVYWCFFLMSDPIARIGTVERPENPERASITISSPVDLSPRTLSTRLRGACAQDACAYQPVCLGGCRKSAYTAAMARGEANPLYAGMDICLTRTYERLRGERSAT